jgi:NADH:ubiquinone oxidoreductase subunit 6 (subunit J)
MNKKVMIGVCAAAMLLSVLAVSVMATDWNDYVTNDSPEKIEFVGPVDEYGNLDQNSLNYALFETYGPLLLIMALLMFGAMIGGVCIAREKGEDE